MTINIQEVEREDCCYSCGDDLPPESCDRCDTCGLEFCETCLLNHIMYCSNDDSFDEIQFQSESVSEW